MPVSATSEQGWVAVLHFDVLAFEAGPSKLENPANYVFTVFAGRDLAINE
ncbi:hypothetical protein CHELA40_12754 [Chelatococcus asaccharovorans]|nr:hypothetical protein CHELA40_12754 [Chelatococcus asaccharovorans]CAH1681753.1 hypothetical protein CHELA17_62866 [Chelatococcus asaccharovorans]